MACCWAVFSPVEPPTALHATGASVGRDQDKAQDAAAYVCHFPFPLPPLLVAYWTPPAAKASAKPIAPGWTRVATVYAVVRRDATPTALAQVPADQAATAFSPVWSDDDTAYARGCPDRMGKLVVEFSTVPVAAVAPPTAVTAPAKDMHAAADAFATPTGAGRSMMKSADDAKPQPVTGLPTPPSASHVLSPPLVNSPVPDALPTTTTAHEVLMRSARKLAVRQSAALAPAATMSAWLASAPDASAAAKARSGLAASTGAASRLPPPPPAATAAAAAAAGLAAPATAPATASDPTSDTGEVPATPEPARSDADADAVALTITPAPASAAFFSSDPLPASQTTTATLSSPIKVPTARVEEAAGESPTEARYPPSRAASTKRKVEPVPPPVSAAGRAAKLARADQPAGRWGHSAVWTREQLLLFLGQGAAGELLDDTVWSSPAVVPGSNPVWAALATAGDAPGKRIGQVSACTDGHVYVLGGSKYKRWLSDLYVLDVANATWSLVPVRGCLSARLAVPENRRRAERR